MIFIQAHAVLLSFVYSLETSFITQSQRTSYEEKPRHGIIFFVFLRVLIGVSNLQAALAHGPGSICPRQRIQMSPGHHYRARPRVPGGGVRNHEHQREYLCGL